MFSFTNIVLMQSVDEDLQSRSTCYGVKKGVKCEWSSWWLETHLHMCVRLLLFFFQILKAMPQCFQDSSSLWSKLRGIFYDHAIARVISLTQWLTILSDLARLSSVKGVCGVCRLIAYWRLRPTNLHFWTSKIFKALRSKDLLSPYSGLSLLELGGWSVFCSQYQIWGKDLKE